MCEHVRLRSKSEVLRTLSASPLVPQSVSVGHLIERPPETCRHVSEGLLGLVPWHRTIVFELTP